MANSKVDEDDDMQDLFEEVFQSFKDAGDVIEETDIVDTIVNYVDNEFVIKNKNGEILVRETRPEVKKQFRFRYDFNYYLSLYLLMLLLV